MRARKCRVVRYHADTMELVQQSPLRQPNELTVLFPRAGKLTGIGRKLHVSLMRTAQVQLQAMAKDGKKMLATDFFKAPLSEIIRPISNPKSNLIEVAKTYVNEMQSTKVTWTAPEGTKEGVIWDQMVLLTQAKVSLEAGKLWLYWGFPQDMVAALTNPNTYTLTQPEELRDLDGYTAVSLYILCSRYINNPSHLTCQRPVNWWIEALKGDAKHVSPKTSSSARASVAKSKAAAPTGKTAGKLPPWRKFKYDHVLGAIEEINAKTPIHIEMIETKSGKAITDVQFRVQRKSSMTPVETHSVAHIRAAELGIPTEEITNHLRSGWSQETLLTVIAKTKARTENADEPLRSTPLTYFRGVLRRIGVQALDQPALPFTPHRNVHAEAQGKGDQQDEPVIPENPPSITPEDVIYEQLCGLSKEAIENLLVEVTEIFREKNLLVGSVAKRIQERGWKSGVVRVYLTNLYGQKMYGPNWKEDIADRIAQSTPKVSFVG